MFGLESYTLNVLVGVFFPTKGTFYKKNISGTELGEELG